MSLLILNSVRADLANVRAVLESSAATLNGLGDLLGASSVREQLEEATAQADAVEDRVNEASALSTEAQAGDNAAPTPSKGRKGSKTAPETAETAPETPVEAAPQVEAVSQPAPEEAPEAPTGGTESVGEFKIGA